MNSVHLLKRVFDIDMHNCPNCGADELKIIAAILERPVISPIFFVLPAPWGGILCQEPRSKFDVPGHWFVRIGSESASRKPSR
jgi:hypothetical protein